MRKRVKEGATFFTWKHRFAIHWKDNLMEGERVKRCSVGCILSFEMIIENPSGGVKIGSVIYGLKLLGYPSQK